MSFTGRNYGRARPAGGSRRPSTVICMPCGGETIICAVDAGTAIAIGDMLWLNTDDARPASMVPDGGSEAANQIAFHDFSIGQAKTAKPAGLAGTVVVQVSGRITLACPSTTWEVGDLIAMNENGAGNALMNQEVTKVVDTSQAIGRCAVRSGGAAVLVTFDMQSTVMAGGPLP